MALPIPLLLLAYPLLSALSRIALGTATAGLVYYFLSNTLKPYMDDLTAQIHSRVSDLSTVGGTSLEVIHYFDLPQMVTILLTCSAACFSLKLMSVAIRAFGINTGS